MKLILFPAWSGVSGRGDWVIWAVVLFTVLWVLFSAASRARHKAGRGRSGRG
jgi:hypothetical protein